MTVVLQLRVSRLAPNRLVENTRTETRCNFTICNFDTERIESQPRREKPELSIDLDRGLGEECSISPSQNIWRGTESSSLPSRSLLLLLSFLGRSSSVVFPRRSLRALLEVRETDRWSQLPEEDICGCDSALTLKRNVEERKEERDSEKGNHKSKRKTDRNDRPVHRVSNFNGW